MANVLLQDILKESSQKHADKAAVVHHNQRMTFSELDLFSDGLASCLIKGGIKKGDRVVLLMENSAAFLISYFGVLKAGAIVVPVNTQLVSRELEHVLRDCTPFTVITEGVFKQFDLSCTVTRDFPEPQANDPAMIIYTSGTTGKPKGVVLSHKNLLANASSIIEYLHLSSSDRTMVILPFYYSYGNSLLTTHILAGATLVIDNRFVFPNVVLNVMEKEQVTGFAGVPSHFAILLRKSALRKYSLNSLRYVTQAGGALAPSLLDEFLAAVPHAQFFVMYGQTEASARLSYLDPAFVKSKRGSIGKAIPGVELEIRLDDGTLAQPGEIGEIVARGDNIMLGYWNAPEETAKVLSKEWLYTGDLAKQDEDGFFYMVSRKKEMIKSGANRISPLEIEDVVSQIPGVVECAAVGVPDEILGEAIKLCVVKNGKPLTPNDVLLHCRQYLATFKMPKEVIFIDHLPKTASGKIKRTELVNANKVIASPKGANQS